MTQERTLQARDAVKTLKEYHPPLSGRAGLRLDFNENTLSCSPRVAARLHEIAGENLTIYPERAPIETLVSQHLRLPADQVLLTNGVDEAIHLICETYLEPESEVVIVVPTFSMYEIYALSTGAKVITVQADPEDEFRFPCEKVLAAITSRTKLVALASPNNPTGAVAASDDVRRILIAAPQAAVLIDEAYFHFHGESMLADIAKYPNLFVARTFSKAYGMAGLRVGVLAGSSEQMPLVRKVSSPYNVNGVALACLPDALADQEFVRDYVSQIKRGRERLQSELKRLQIRFWRSHANFVLMKIGLRRTELVQKMRQRGILVRDRNSDPGCAGCVRITIGTEEQMDRLFTALHETLREIGASSVVEQVHP